MNHFINALKNYAVIKGHSRKSEFWYFMLFTFIIERSVGLTEYFLGFSEAIIGGFVTRIVEFVLLLPSITVAIRRMHDLNLSGWYMLVPIYSIVLTLTKGDNGPNEYGDDPKSSQF